MTASDASVGVDCSSLSGLMVARSSGKRRAALNDRVEGIARLREAAQDSRKALERGPGDRRTSLGHCEAQRDIGLARLLPNGDNPLSGSRDPVRVAGLDRREQVIGRIEQPPGRLEPDRQRDEPGLPRRQLVVALAGRTNLVGRRCHVAVLESAQRRVERHSDLRGAQPHLDELVAGGRAVPKLGGDRAQVLAVHRCRGPAAVGRGRAADRSEACDEHAGLVDRVVQYGARLLQQGSGRLVAGDDTRAAAASGIEPWIEGGFELGDRVERGSGPCSKCGSGGDHVLRRGELGGRRPLTEEEAKPEDGESGRRRGTSPYHSAMEAVAELRALPKAELHQHLDGSVRPETAVELAAEAGLALDLDEARRRMVAPTRCANQAALLEFFDLPIRLLQTASALRRVSAELVDSFIDDGIRYAEVRWAPRLHLDENLSVQDVIDAVVAGIADAAGRHGPATPIIGLIVTAMRSHPPIANVELARVAGAFGRPIVGFDLAGPEAEYPAPPHAAAFRAARDAGLSLTVHAGEVPGAEHVREALDLGARRVAHGVTAADDPEIVSLLRARDVTLDMCPTSNVQAAIVTDLESHPIGALHRAGVSVTLSTDDRTVTGTTLSAEFAAVASVQGLSRTELREIALNGFRRAFAPPNVIAPMLAAAQAAWDGWAELREGVIG
jgi:adenosine deaminase